MTPRTRYRCRYCGAELPAWLPVAKRPNGALLLGHWRQQDPDEVFEVGQVMKLAERPQCLGQKGATRWRRP
jgi:hypothetical protein